MERCRSCDGSGNILVSLTPLDKGRIGGYCPVCTGTGMVGTSPDLDLKAEIDKRAKAEAAVDRAFENKA